MNKDIYFLDYIIKKDCSPNKDYHNFFQFLQNYKNNSELFINVSILSKNEYLNYKKEFENKIDNNNLTKLERACIGSILGMAIGDAMGARTEFKPLIYEYNKVQNMGNSIGGIFKLHPGQWTDDTSMGLCLADSLIEKKGKFEPKDIMIRFILWWFFGYNNSFRFDEKRKNRHSVGLGGNIKESLYSFINSKGANEYTNCGNENTSGNGTIMRNAAIPICYFSNYKIALRYAKCQSLITHKGYEAAGCCQLLTFIVIKILNNKKAQLLNTQSYSGNSRAKDLKEILDDLSDFNCEYKSVNFLAYSKQEGEDKDRNWNWKSESFKYSETRAKKNPNYIGSYCMDGLAMALHILYHTSSFERAILKAVNLCGDSDSVASVVGQIAGAYYEMDAIPKDWIKAINDWDHNEIALRGYILCHLNKIKIDGSDGEFSEKDNKRVNNENIKEERPIIQEKEMENKKSFNPSINKKRIHDCCYIF